MKISPKQNRGFAAAIVMLAIATIFAALSVGFSMSKSHNTPQVDQSPAAGSINTVGAPPFFLYGSGVGASDTSITLTYFYINVSKQKLRMSDFGTIGYLTLEPGNALRQEFVSFTGVTQNSDGTATLTGVSRGLSPITPFTASTTLQKTHGGGTSAVISNPPQLYELFANKSNDQTITGTWNFASTAPPRMDVDPGAAYYTTAPTTVLVDLAQLNRTASAGAANASETTAGLVELATGKEAASSTSLGGSGARLGLPASLATSSPSFSATSTIVMTRLDGRIDPGFLATTTGTTYTLGNLTVNGATTLNGFTATASSTHTATTTIAASSVTNNALVLNGLAYKMPSGRGASSTSLQEDGSGNLTFEQPKFAVIGTASNLSSSASAALTDLYTVAIPANTLSLTSVIHIIMSCFESNNGISPDIFQPNFGNGTATTSLQATCNGSDSAAGHTGFSDIYISSTSTSAELISGTYSIANTGVMNYTKTPAAYNTTGKLYLNFQCESNASGNHTCGAPSIVVESITQ